jgi:transcriptional regulator with XRE-family HTH domain
VLPESKLFFKRLGARLRQLRKARGWTVDDMQVRGVTAKHWQQIETGRAINVRTLLRASQALEVSAAFLVADLDAGIYKRLPLPLPRKQRKSLKKQYPRSTDSKSER